MTIRKYLKKLLDFYLEYEQRIRDAHDPNVEGADKKLTREEISELKRRWLQIKKEIEGANISDEDILEYVDRTAHDKL
jgi:hypothetical protein